MTEIIDSWNGSWERGSVDADWKQTQRRIRTETRTWIHRKPWTCPRIRHLTFDSQHKAIQYGSYSGGKSFDCFSGYREPEYDGHAQGFGHERLVSKSVSESGFVDFGHEQNKKFGHSCELFN